MNNTVDARRLISVQAAAAYTSLSIHTCQSSAEVDPFILM